MRVIISLALGALIGCATMTERIVNEAMKGSVFTADYKPRAGGNPEHLKALFDHLVEDLRIDVQFLPKDDETLRGAYGISYSAGQHLFIRLRDDLSVNASIEVLAHEAAHLFQPPYLSKSQGDVFAEIVSAHVAAALDVPEAAKTSALWLRQHKPALRMALDLQQEIEHVVRILLPGSAERPAAIRR